MKERESISEFFWFLRRPAQFLADVCVLSAAFLLSYLPAINVQLGEYYIENAVRQLPFVVLVQFSALFLVGGYSILWRYVSIEDIKVFIKAAAVATTVLVAVRFLPILVEYNIWQVPVSVIFIDAVLGFGGMLAIRVLRRFVYELGDDRRILRGRRMPERKAALLVGAGRIGATIAKEVSGRRDAELDIRGFVDDDPRKKGGSVSGIKVLGSTNLLPKFVDELDIKQVVIAIDDARGKDIRRIVNICGSIPVRAQIVPSLNEIAHGRVSVSRIRDVEIDDLLGREPVKLDTGNLETFLSDKTIMVTGAGGSIGSELIRQIATYQPRKLLLIERAEFLLFQIEREIRKKHHSMEIIPLIADICDRPRMREIFARYRPDVVFHAAAHKHVPLMETNVCEAIKNNVFGTKLTAELAGEFDASKFVLVSTDKAVNPTSVMGSSKRLAEIVAQQLNGRYNTAFVAVRFGNVLGSAGSVVPIFKEQIEAGGPVTVTDPKMTRYFMTIPEASQLVMQAGALGLGGEIFILDMGQPVKILDLAEDMIRLSGLVPYDDIDIVFTGIRPGEKLFEELEITGEDLEKTRHPQIFIGKIATYSDKKVSAMIERLSASLENGNDDDLRDVIREFVPESQISVRKTGKHSEQIAKTQKPLTRSADLQTAE
ncbi:polysaccharide biosynthesis protein [Leptolyngbya sp. 7M]|uniref:polysaccharide biosynthesis protein n=1 Tax=Leptolyngbya sp. 7M TaxID=2812896 RepID=UPI001B8D3FF8|nr:nucleoside-diphosphate sugar epimerase/dehydratase [Leptolyngbya sp. 7M]QYO67552.1 polysaccharide biosynthesis protein [Leptolyngbya sp. 7M]